MEITKHIIEKHGLSLEEFKSIQPDFTNVMQEDKSLEGAVYNGRGGLFASDVRANNVGDIITVKMPIFLQN